LGRIFDELKRRNVIRVAVAYIVAAWLVLQVADLVLQNIQAPDWVMQVFLLVFALGMPLALMFSWAYELTPEGLKHESEVDRDDSITHGTGRKLNLITIAMLVAVVTLVGLERTLFSESAPPAAESAAVITDKSIAVLAFQDLSAEGDQEYFADGLSEELLNVLAQIPDLQVAGRTSSFAFKGQNRDLREIGDILNVAHILEGSVRKSGNRIRVTAQLINASNGFHLFSETYDRDLTDIFALQDEIAGQISSALQSRLMGTAMVQQATPTEFAAYDLYLLARQLIYTRDKENMFSAMGMLDEALTIDPEYAPALAQKALVIYLLSDIDGAYGDIPGAEAVALARPLVDKALSIDSRLAEAHAISGLILSTETSRLEESVAQYRRALNLNPNLDNANNWLSIGLGNLGRNEEAIALLEDIVARDPLYGPAFGNLVQDYVGNRKFDRSDALIGRIFRIVGETGDVSQARGTHAYMQGNLANAMRHLKISYDRNPAGTIVKQWYGLALLSIGDYAGASSAGILAQQLRANELLGNIEEAESIIASIDPHSGDANYRMHSVSRYLVNAGRYGDLIAFIEEHFGGSNELLVAQPQIGRWSTGYFGPLAYAFHQQGMETEYNELLVNMKEALTTQRAANLDNFFHWYSEAEYAALQGNVEDVVRHLQRVLDYGYVTTDFLNSPIFDSVRNDARLQEMKQQTLQRVDKERAKLGMAPFRPIATTRQD